MASPEQDELMTEAFEKCSCSELKSKLIESRDKLAVIRLAVQPSWSLSPEGRKELRELVELIDSINNTL